MPSYFNSQGQSISLVKEIAKGGEGTVWKTDHHNGYLGKIYHKPTPQQVEKLKLMLANPPKNPYQVDFSKNFENLFWRSLAENLKLMLPNPPEHPTTSQDHIAISWPVDLIKDSQENCVGFLMPEITNAKEMINVYHPALRCQEYPRFNWHCLHIIALNFVYILHEIHAINYIIGDISPTNILVNDKGLVSLIDTDSFQIEDSKTGKVYPCSVGLEGFIPPELVGEDLAKITQTQEHDHFRLAVIIYYLLFGYHPFMGMGIWIGSGNPPGQHESIRRGYWPYGVNTLLEPSLNTIPLNVVHPELEKLFLKCFNDGHKEPSSRPSPKDWFYALLTAINDLVVCSNNKNHIYSGHYDKCCWCERENNLKQEKNLKRDIFPSVKNPIPPKTIKLIQQPPTSVKKNISVAAWKTIAIVSIIINIVLAGLSFLQYRERNQIIRPIERLQNNSLSNLIDEFEEEKRR